MVIYLKICKKEKPKETTRNEKNHNLKLNTLEEKLINSRIRRYGHVLRMNEERIPNKVLNMTV
jgi:hypothetical protein